MTLVSLTFYRYLQKENNKVILRELVLSSSKFFILLLYIICFFKRSNRHQEVRFMSRHHSIS